MAKTLNSAPTAGSTYAGRSEVQSTANHKAMNNEQMQFENEEQKKSLERMEVKTFEQSEQSESLLEMQERLRLEQELEAEQKTELQKDNELEVPVEGQEVQLESKHPEYDVTSKSKSLVHGNSDKEKEEVVEPDLEAIGAMDEADKDIDKKDKSLELSDESQVESQSTVNVTSRQVSVTDYSKYNQAIEEQYFADKADKYDTLVGAASEVIDEAQCDSMKKENEVSIEETTQTVNVKPDDSQQGKEVEGNQATTETAGQIEAESKKAETQDQPQAQRQSEKMSVESEVKTAQPKNTMSREEMMAKYAYVGENYEKQNASYERAQNADYPARMPSLDGPRMKMH